MVVGDPVDGTLFLLVTTDGGGSWERFPGPRSQSHGGRVRFRSSGTNIATFGADGLAVVSGGPVARVFRSEDRGLSWSVVSTPMAAGNPSSGIFSIAFRDPESATLVGGDYQSPEMSTGTIARSTDGGMSWALAPEPHGIGFRSGVAWREDPVNPCGWRWGLPDRASLSTTV